MGIYVCVVNRYGSDNPSWDFIRHSGDREIPGLLDEIGYTEIEESNDDFDGLLQRPNDIERFYRRLIELCPQNSERWKLLVDLLRDENNWLYIS